MASTSSSSDKRTRNWSFIVYPDSAPEDWKSYLDSISVPWICSPLHDMDFNPTGELKKSHWHCLLLFSGKKSFEQICEILKPLNCPIPQVCHSAEGAIRYMIHRDNPDKHQYSQSDIEVHGNIDIDTFFLPTRSQRQIIVKDIIQFCNSNNICEFADIVDYSIENNSEWFSLLTESYSIFFSSYFKSKRYRN